MPGNPLRGLRAVYPSMFTSTSFGISPVGHLCLQSSEMKTKLTRVLSLQPRLRVRVGDEIALGPGKVELLELVQQTGSITEAARQLADTNKHCPSNHIDQSGCFRPVPNQRSTLLSNRRLP